MSCAAIARSAHGVESKRSASECIRGETVRNPTGLIKARREPDAPSFPITPWSRRQQGWFPAGGAPLGSLDHELAGPPSGGAQRARRSALVWGAVRGAQCAAHGRTARRECAQRASRSAGSTVALRAPALSYRENALRSALRFAVCPLRTQRPQRSALVRRSQRAALRPARRLEVAR